MKSAATATGLQPGPNMTTVVPTWRYPVVFDGRRALKRSMIVWLAVMTAPLAAGCFLQNSPGPDAAAKTWVQALVGPQMGDSTENDRLARRAKLRELTCDAAQVRLQDVASLYSSIGIPPGFRPPSAEHRLFTADAPMVDLDRLEFVTARDDGTTAAVQVKGEILLGTGQLPQGVGLNPKKADYTLPMRRERDQWRYCP